LSGQKADPLELVAYAQIEQMILARQLFRVDLAAVQDRVPLGVAFGRGEAIYQRLDGLEVP
jgi:hypothetical protein